MKANFEQKKLINKMNLYKQNINIYIEFILNKNIKNLKNNILIIEV